MANPKYRVGEAEVLTQHIKTTAAAQDIDVLLLEAREKPFYVENVSFKFTELDTFASGVDLNVESDDGTTETEIANYDTVSGTDVDTIYDATFTGERRVEIGEWLQVRIDDNEDAACGVTITLEFYWLAG